MEPCKLLLFGSSLMKEDTFFFFPPLIKIKLLIIHPLKPCGQIYSRHHSAGENIIAPWMNLVSGV